MLSVNIHNQFLHFLPSQLFPTRENPNRPLSCALCIVFGMVLCFFFNNHLNKHLIFFFLCHHSRLSHIQHRHLNYISHSHIIIIMWPPNIFSLSPIYVCLCCHGLACHKPTILEQYKYNICL